MGRLHAAGRSAPAARHRRLGRARIVPRTPDRGRPARLLPVHVPRIRGHVGVRPALRGLRRDLRAEPGRPGRQRGVHQRDRCQRTLHRSLSTSRLGRAEPLHERPAGRDVGRPDRPGTSRWARRRPAGGDHDDRAGPRPRARRPGGRGHRGSGLATQPGGPRRRRLLRRDLHRDVGSDRIDDDLGLDRHRARCSFRRFSSSARQPWPACWSPRGCPPAPCR